MVLSLHTLPPIIHTVATLVELAEDIEGGEGIEDEDVEELPPALICVPLEVVNLHLRLQYQCPTARRRRERLLPLPRLDRRAQLPQRTG